MKSGLFILPFLALLVVAIGTAVKSSYPGLAWVGASSLVLALALLVFWISWDIDNFKKFLRRKGAKFGASSSLTVILGIAIIVAIAVLSSRARFNKSVDVTRSQTNTLSDQSLKVIAKVKESEAPVQMTAWFQDQMSKGKFRDLLALYQIEGAELNVKWLDPRKEPTQAMADKLTSANTVILRRGKLETRIATFTEEKFTNALVKVLKDKSKKIYFTQGHGEGELKAKSPLGYDFVTQELENNKYTTETLMLLETGKVPSDADLVIVAGPRYDLRKEEVDFLRTYLQGGGALMVMFDAVTQMNNLATFTAEFGIKVNNDLLLLPPDDPRALLLGQNNALVTDFDDFHSVTKDFARQGAATLLMPNVRSLHKEEDNKQKMNVELVAKTSDSIVKVDNVTSNSDLGNITKDRVTAGKFAVIAVATGKTKTPQLADAGAEQKKAEAKDVDSKSLPVAEEKQVRLIVTGSSHFARNQGVQAAVEHRDMFVNMTNFLLKDEDFISLRPRDVQKSSIALTSSMSQLVLVLICFCYPFIFLGSGVITWLRRRAM